MRNDFYAMSRPRSLRLLERTPALHLASTSPDGAPIGRTMHFVLLDGFLAVHGAPAGEKLACLGREAVLTAECTVASIPSYFVDAERACPATTYYESVQVRGAIEPVDDPEWKAAMLAAFMRKYQPEGGHVPIEAEHPLYRGMVRGLLVARVALDRLEGKGKLGQNRTPEQRRLVLERLWERGLPGDPEAIERVREANPDTPVPRFLAGPAGANLVCALDERDVEAAVDLLEHEYWNATLPRETIARAQLGSGAWVGARDESGRLIANARAIGDRAKYAWIYDVVVHPDWRGRGLGQALMRLLLDHPLVRGARATLLDTRDAQRLYERFGFVDRKTETRPYPSTQMVRRRT